MTQTLLPGTVLPNDSPQPDVDGPTKKLASKGKASVRPYENNLVRTDASLRKITSMFQPAIDDSAAAEQVEDLGPEYEHSDKEPVVCRLTSVRELRTAVRDDMHHSLTEIFAGHTFVGVVDERRRLAAMQGGVKLYLVDYGRACFEYFYQVGLTDFGNFGTIRFQPTLDLREVLSIAAEREKATAAEGELAEDDDFDVEEVVNAVAEQLIERREMLLEYFSLEVTPAGELLSIPLLTKGYTPSMAKLPQFLLRLGPHVDWTDEQSCFETFLRELSSFYVPEQLPPLPGNAEQLETEDIPDEIRARRAHVRRAVEHVFFPAFKNRLVATKSLMNGGVLELADLKGLYRVFERC
jgi:DNA mismatch repair protein MLH1